MIYLREIKIPGRVGYKTTLELFEGDINKDKKYWMKTHRATSVRYFKLIEVK